MSDALLIGLGVFLALEAHAWRNRRPKDAKPLLTQAQEAIRSLKPQEKAEFMLPMTDEEFHAHIDSLSAKGELNESLERPWTSPPPKSPSLDS